MVRSVIRMPDYEQVAQDPVLYAHASRILHLEANPHNARALVQKHGDLDLWINPAADPAGDAGHGTACTSCPTKGARIRPMARQRSPPTR